MIAARVVAGLDAGRPGVAAARLWTWTTPSIYGDGRIIGEYEPAAPRHDKNNVVSIKATKAQALEIACALVAEKRARGRPDDDEWPSAAELVSLTGDRLGWNTEAEALCRDAEALLERQAVALDMITATLLRRGFWSPGLDDAAALVEKRRGLGRVVVPFRVQAA